MARSRVVDIDKGYRSFFKHISKVGHKSLNVGVDSSAKYPDGTPVHFVAAVHEYGTSKHRERAYMRRAIDGNRAEILLLTNKLLGKVIDGDLSIDQAIGILGEYQKTLIQRELLREKLIDTGKLLSSIGWEIET